VEIVGSATVPANARICAARRRQCFGSFVLGLSIDRDPVPRDATRPALSVALIGVPVVVIARATWQVAPMMLSVPNIEVEHRRRCWRWVYRAVRHRLCPGLCRHCSADERACSCRRCCYAEHDGRSRRNQMFAHFFNSRCSNEYGSPRHDRCTVVAMIGLQLHQLEGRAIFLAVGVSPFSVEHLYNSRPPVRPRATAWTTCYRTIQRPGPVSTLASCYFVEEFVWCRTATSEAMRDLLTRTASNAGPRSAK
jgi:hypothetical protein